jgi:hypothetical protein
LGLSPGADYAERLVLTTFASPPLAQVEAYEKSQKYKEGKVRANTQRARRRASRVRLTDPHFSAAQFILEKCRIVDENGSELESEDDE